MILPRSLPPSRSNIYHLYGEQTRYVNFQSLTWDIWSYLVKFVRGWYFWSMHEINSSFTRSFFSERWELHVNLKGNNGRDEAAGSQGTWRWQILKGLKFSVARSCVQTFRGSSVRRERATRVLEMRIGQCQGKQSSLCLPVSGRDRGCSIILAQCRVLPQEPTSISTHGRPALKWLAPSTTWWHLAVCLLSVISGIFAATSVPVSQDFSIKSSDDWLWCFSSKS